MNSKMFLKLQTPNGADPVFNDRARVLFLGLGGLGLETISELKAQYQQFDQAPSRVRFLAVDSDEYALKHYSGGESEDSVLAPAETFSLYSADSNLFYMINGEEIPAAMLKDGARFDPSIGRLMLCGQGNKYGPLRDTLRALLNELAEDLQPGERVRVAIVSSLGGGTGAGIALDVCYLVRLLLQALVPEEQSEVFGVFYSAEACLTIPLIGGDPYISERIQENSEKTLEVLSRFMASESSSPDAQPRYELSLPNEEHILTYLPVLEPGHAFLISGSGPEQDFGEIRKQTVSGLMRLLYAGEGGSEGSHFLLRANFTPAE